MSEQLFLALTDWIMPKLLEVNTNGLYCAQADVYIDPWRPVNFALITHGHADHMRWGNKKYLVHKDTVPVLKVRLGDVVYQAIDYNQTITINGVTFSYHPAGHILGSSQIRLEYKGEIWVVTGDYKLLPDGLSPEFEPVKCHSFITESTFGLPIYNFESPIQIFDEILEWVKINQSQHINSIVTCYSLGKAQSILNYFEDIDIPIFLHGAVANLNDAFKENGYYFKGEKVTQETDKNLFKNCMVIAPPAVLDSAWIRKFGTYKTAFCSGWMQLRGARRRKGVDKGFIFSDHCDFKSLNAAIDATGAENIYITHGYEDLYAQYLKSEKGLNAQIMKTLFNDEQEDEEVTL